MNEILENVLSKPRKVNTCCCLRHSVVLNLVSKNYRANNSIPVSIRNLINYFSKIFEGLRLFITEHDSYLLIAEGTHTNFIYKFMEK